MSPRDFDYYTQVKLKIVLCPEHNLCEKAWIHGKFKDFQGRMECNIFLLRKIIQGLKSV
jgi:hypothetical protein